MPKPKLDDTYMITTHEAELPCGGNAQLSIQVLNWGPGSPSTHPAGDVHLYVDQAHGHQDMVMNIRLTEAEVDHLITMLRRARDTR